MTPFAVYKLLVGRIKRRVRSDPFPERGDSPVELSAAKIVRNACSVVFSRTSKSAGLCGVSAT
jgi:hypothetical protein